MNPNQLDLSKFPHIVPPENQATPSVEKSRTLVAIQQAMENLINLMQSYIVELQSLDQKASFLDKREVHANERDYEQNQKEKKLFALEDSIKQEKAYIAQANFDLKKREEELAGNKNFLAEIEKAKIEWEERKNAALKQEILVDEKIKQAKELDRKRLELEEKEAVLEKSADIDAERKRLLDIREERIRNTERRLSIDNQE